MNQSTMYHYMVQQALNYFVGNQYGFEIRTMAPSTIPREHVTNGTTLINITNWSLEEARVSESYLHVPVVYGETPIDLDIPLVDIVTLVDTSTNALILARTYVTKSEDVVLKKSPLANAKFEAFQKEHAKAIEHSTSRLTLLMKGHEQK